MTHRVLVAYASRAGSTAEVAEVVGATLREAGFDVTVRSVNDVDDVSGYDALVLGSAIWAGRPLPEARKLMQTHRAALAEVPVAYFILCERLQQYTPANRQIALGYLAPLVKLKQPVRVATFAGARDFGTVNPIVRWLLERVLKLTEGDWRNWDQIRDWAASLAQQLAPAARETALSA